MNYTTRVRWLQFLVGASLLAFLGFLTLLLLDRDSRVVPKVPEAQEILEAEGMDAQAEQLSTKFEVTRTREGIVELTIRAEKLLGLEGDVYLLEQPTLIIHHPGGKTSTVAGADGTFDMSTGTGRVEGEAHALLRGTMEVDARVLIYNDGGKVDAEGGTRFKRPGMSGRSRELSYLPGADALFLSGDVHVEGQRPGQAETTAPWTLETQRLRYHSETGEARAGEFELVSNEGILSGGRLDLWIEPEDGGLQKLIATTDAAIRIALASAEQGPSTEAWQVLVGDRIEMEPAEDGSDEPRHLLASGNARLFREGLEHALQRSLSGETIEWFRAEQPGETSRIEAAGQTVLELGSLQGGATLTASRLEATLDEFGDVHEGTAFAPVRYQGPEGTARCETADFTAAGARVVLRSETGEPAVIQLPEGRIAARRIDLWRDREELQAVDEVRTLHERSSGGNGLFAGEEPVHGTADRVVALRGEGRIRYLGAARLWQNENLIQADELEVQRDAGILEASGRVSTRSVNDDAQSAGPRVIRGAAESFVYRDAERKAVYSGDAVLEWGVDRVEADRIDLSLAEGRTLQSLLALGRVKLTNPGRFARGDQLDYDVSSKRAILIGREQPAMAQDLNNQQVVYGQTLTIEFPDGTMQLESGQGGRTWITLSPEQNPPDSAQEIRPGETRGEQRLGTSPGR